MGTCFFMSKMYKEAVKYMSLALDLNTKLNGEKNEINKMNRKQIIYLLEKILKKRISTNIFKHLKQ